MNSLPYERGVGYSPARHEVVGSAGIASTAGGFSAGNVSLIVKPDGGRCREVSAIADQHSSCRVAQLVAARTFLSRGGFLRCCERCCFQRFWRPVPPCARSVAEPALPATTTIRQWTAASAARVMVTALGPHSPATQMLKASSTKAKPSCNSRKVCRTDRPVRVNRATELAGRTCCAKARSRLVPE